MDTDSTNILYVVLILTKYSTCCKGSGLTDNTDTGTANASETREPKIGITKIDAVHVGDVILNRWAGDRNPTRVFIVTHVGRDVSGRTLSGKSRSPLQEVGFLTRNVKEDVKPDGLPAFVRIGHVDIAGSLRRLFETTMGEYTSRKSLEDPEV